MSFKTIFTTESNYEGQPKSIITHETDAVSLGDILQAFEDHLKGSGFYFRGNLGIVEEEDNEDSRQT